MRSAQKTQESYYLSPSPNPPNLSNTCTHILWDVHLLKRAKPDFTWVPRYKCWHHLRTPGRYSEQVTDFHAKLSLGNPLLANGFLSFCFCQSFFLPSSFPFFCNFVFLCLSRSILYVFLPFILLFFSPSPPFFVYLYLSFSSLAQKSERTSNKRVERGGNIDRRCKLEEQRPTTRPLSSKHHVTSSLPVLAEVVTFARANHVKSTNEAWRLSGSERQKMLMPRCLIPSSCRPVVDKHTQMKIM